MGPGFAAGRGFGAGAGAGSVVDVNGRRFVHGRHCRYGWFTFVIFCTLLCILWHTCLIFIGDELGSPSQGLSSLAMGTSSVSLGMGS